MEKTYIEKIHIARNHIKAEYRYFQKSLIEQIKKLETIKNKKEYDKEFKSIFKNYNSICISYEKDLHTLRIFKPDKKERKAIEKILDRYDYDFT